MWKLDFGFIEAKIRASDKDLPVIMKQQQTSAKQTRMSGEQNTSGLFDDLDELFGTLTAEEVAELSIVDPDVRLFIILDKVQLFWEGHKNLRNRPHGFDV